MTSAPSFADRLGEQKFHPSWWAIVFHPFFIIRRRLRAAVAAHAPKIRGKVLDLGCGSKPYVRYFSGATSYIGVDVEQSGHDHRSSNIDIFYDGHKLPFDEGDFDAVVSFETFEHIFNLEEVIAELLRVLAPGGSLLATLPFAFPEHEVPYDFGRYTRYGLTAMLSRAGFEAIEARPVSTPIEAIGQLMSAYLFGTLAKNSRSGKALLQLFVNFPITLLTLCVSALLPKHDTLYCNIIVTARKPNAA